MNRKLAIGGALLAAAALAALVKAGDESEVVRAPAAAGEVVFPPPGQGEPETRSLPATVVRLDLLERGRQKPPLRDIFAARSWEPPAPSPAPSAPSPTVVEVPPTPAAPPLPFVFLGTLDRQDGNVVYYLAQGERVLAVALGEVIDDLYRIDAEEDGMLSFTYLPMKARLVLRIARPS